MPVDHYILFQVHFDISDIFLVLADISKTIGHWFSSLVMCPKSKWHPVLDPGHTLTLKQIFDKLQGQSRPTDTLSFTA